MTDTSKTVTPQAFRDAVLDAVINFADERVRDNLAQWQQHGKLSAAEQEATNRILSLAGGLARSMLLAQGMTPADVEAAWAKVQAELDAAWSAWQEGDNNPT